MNLGDFCSYSNIYCLKIKMYFCGLIYVLNILDLSHSVVCLRHFIYNLNELICSFCNKLLKWRAFLEKHFHLTLRKKLITTKRFTSVYILKDTPRGRKRDTQRETKHFKLYSRFCKLIIINIIHWCTISIVT